MIQFQSLPQDRVGIRFPYDESVLEAFRRIPGRLWNKEEERWEIPLVGLGDAVTALGIDWDRVPSRLRKAYQDQTLDCMVLRIDNVWTEIQGKDIPLEVLDEATSFWVEGAEYSQKYQDGIWDGFKRLMRKRGKITFPTGLLAAVESALKNVHHEYRVVDTRIIPNSEISFPTFGPDLREYQFKALEVADRNERGVLQLATGAGKTLLAAHIIARRGLRALFFVHTKDLLYQAIRVFESILQRPIGQVGDGKVDVQLVTVATIQTAARALDVKIEKEGGDDVPLWKDDAGERLSAEEVALAAKALQSSELVIFDECHHLPAESFYQIAMKLWKAYFRYGLSATPWRSDRSDLMIEAATGKKLFTVSSTDLIRQGYLVAPKITMVEMLPSGKKLSRNYAKVYSSEVVEHPERNALIAEAARYSADKGRTVLILVNQVKHGRNLEAMIPGSVFIHGKDPSDVRKQALAQLREKTHPILIATTLADEGLDLPTLGVLILAGGGKSETRALQRVGRVLRPAEGKHTAIIVDFWDQCPYLEEHSRHRFEIYRTESAFDVDIRPPMKKGWNPTARQRILAEN